MARDTSSASRRAHLNDICCALPEVEAESHGRHVKFSVRGRTVAYYTDDHHGDGKKVLTCKAPPGMRDAIVATDPERFFVPSYLGAKGWIALRLDLPDIDWIEVDELVTNSYQLVAPKRLVALMDSAPPRARQRPRPRRR